jgi:hypothetical protein
MERELFVLLMDALRALPEPRRRPPKGTYRDLDVLAVLIWAALHDRPISWATQRRHWPAHDRTRPLPTSSTMSRRLRTPGLSAALTALILSLRDQGDGQETLVVDGRPLRIAPHSVDPDARFGRAAGGLGKGYKLHEIVDLRGNCRGFRVEPLNASEHVVARQLVATLRPNEACELLADGNYDVNALYDVAGSRGIQLLTAPRNTRAKALGHHRHSEHRLRGMEIVRNDPDVLDRRRRIESCFGTQGNVVGGLGPLPNFVRRLHRVRIWVAAKLAIDAAHRRRRARRRTA